MKRLLSFVLVALLILPIVSLCGCNKELKEEAAGVAEQYNTLVGEYNESIKPYNEAVNSIEEANKTFNSEIDAAQASIDKGEKPFDTQTETDLKDGIVAANKKIVAVPDKLEEKEKVNVDENWGKSELEDFISSTNSDIETLSSSKAPETPTIPDYSEDKATLAKLKLNYEDSIQGLKQITAPSDDFVMKRLQLVETITAMDAVTEDHDPNEKLNKQGGYIGCIYFTDSRINKNDLHLQEGEDNVIDIGTVGGGAVEVFSSVEDAEARDKYLATVQNITSTDNSHYVRGTCVIRTSEHLTGSQQKSLTEEITNALIKVEH